MNLYKNFKQRQALLLALVCLIILPTLMYRYPAQILGFFKQYSLTDELSLPQHHTEAEMLHDFVDFLRHQESHEVKSWGIKGALILPYSSTDLDALINTEVMQPTRTKDTLQGEQRLCNEKAIHSKKS